MLVKFKWGDYTAVEAPRHHQHPTPPNLTQMHLCRLIRFVLLALPPTTYRTFSLCGPALLLSLFRSLSSRLSFQLSSDSSLSLPLQLGLHVSGSADRQLMYCETKMAARPYQTAKQHWFRSLQETGLGTWVKKPPEQEQFLLLA